jgi:4-hydroxythreonine-4-phosphate dehydrogenase
MVKHSENIIVGVSIGDMNGIGPEVVLKTFEDTRMLDICTPVIFANAKIVSFLKRTYNLNAFIQGIDNLDQIVLGKINVLNVWREGANLENGKLDEEIGKYDIKSFQAATSALKNNQIDVLVTAPIN